MRPDRLTGIQFGLLAATALLVILFLQTRTADLELHNRRVDLLLQLKQAEDALDRDALRVASFLLVQYDPLVEALRRIRGLSGQIRSPGLTIEGDGGAPAAASLGAYLAALDRKLDLLERLKSTAALVRNGLHYLPGAVREFQALGVPDGDGVTRLLNDLLHFNLFPAELESRRIGAEIAEVRRLTELSGPEQAALDNLLLHMGANLRMMGELAGLRDRYIGVPSGRDFDASHDAFNAHYARQSRTSELFSLLLLAIAVSLFVGLGLALRGLQRARAQAERAWSQLRDAVESLSEAFALFGPDGRLVLHNSRYLAFYPWLADLLAREATLERVRERNAVGESFVPPDDPVVPDDLPIGAGRTYVEQLRDGRWYLASDARTSAGETVCVRVDITESKRAEQELRKLHRAVEQSPAAVVITDTKGCIEYVNPKFVETTGFAAEEALGQNPRMLKSGDKTPEEYRELWETILSGRVWRGQFHNRRKDGTIYWESASISPVRDARGGITHFIAVKEDITARKRAEEQLRMNATVFETTNEGIMVTDADNRIKTVNPAFTRITGYRSEEVVGRNPRLLGSGRHDGEFYRAMWSTLRQKGYWSGEIWNRRKDGSVFPEWLSLAAIRNDGQEVEEYVAVFSDITRRKEDEEQIRRQANFDALTGLPNRSLLVDRLARALSSARREQWLVALLFVDLDRFKGVNDTLGHVVGDELLQQVAIRLRACVRDADTVGRFGGDEFLVILEDISRADDAAEVAKKIILSLNQPFHLGGRELFVGASIGITLFPSDTADPNSMLRNADMAMYRAKDAGRNNYQFFTPAMNEQVQQRIDLERDLRRALDRGELSLRYQPVVRIGSGTITAVEALLAWHHPERGSVSPARFIPLAEETGIIGALGLWVLRTACSQVAAWRGAGHALRVCVNLSSRQLGLGLSPGELKAILDEAGLPPTALTLEITEGLILDGDSGTLDWLRAVRALGVSLAVDDFGTGYSSLSYLKRYPMDTLKIDRSFVRDLADDPGDSALVEAILAMAKSLGLDVVAEGVETPDQLERLQGLGCTLAQGFLFSRPLDPERVPGLLGRPLRPASEPATEGVPTELIPPILH